MRITADQLIDAIEESGDYTARSYSGRYMYGASCVGVEVSREQNMFELIGVIALALVAEATSFSEETTLDDYVRLLRGTRTDSMGLGSIIYWPDLRWPDGREEHTDDTD